MRTFAFILLLLHVNFSMFIAQVDEQDVYDYAGRQMRDIDSLTDWLQATFAKRDAHKHHKDKDDDNARYFHLLKPTHFFSPQFTLMKKPTGAINVCPPVINETALASGYSSIQLPPPKA